MVGINGGQQPARPCDARLLRNSPAQRSGLPAVVELLTFLGAPRPVPTDGKLAHRRTRYDGRSEKIIRLPQLHNAFFRRIGRPPRSTLFSYSTLFRAPRDTR